MWPYFTTKLGIRLLPEWLVGGQASVYFALAPTQPPCLLYRLTPSTFLWLSHAVTRLWTDPDLKTRTSASERQQAAESLVELRNWLLYHGSNASELEPGPIKVRLPDPPCPESVIRRLDMVANADREHERREREWREGWGRLGRNDG